MTSKSALIFATTAAIALASFDMRPAAAAPEGGPALVKQNNGTEDFSSQRRRRGRGVNPAIPLAAFGALIGTIGAVAAANRQREVYYGGGPYYYAEPQYVAPPTYYYAQPQPYVRRHHYAPAPRHYGHHHGPRQYGGGQPQNPPPNLQSGTGDGGL
jgi:hypothetical protein